MLSSEIPKIDLRIDLKTLGEALFQLFNSKLDTISVTGGLFETQTFSIFEVGALVALQQKYGCLLSHKEPNFVAWVDYADANFGLVVQKRHQNIHGKFINDEVGKISWLITNNGSEISPIEVEYSSSEGTPQRSSTLDNLPSKLESLLHEGVAVLKLEIEALN